jgi:glycosyltransferase involved in cell wall biosynthesis
MSRYVARHGLERNIEFLPPIFDKNRLNALIAAADVICVPSLSGETFSMAILEAMALSKPVLVSDFSPMPEAVDHEVTGYVARAGDAGSIAEGMRFFATHSTQLTAIGANGFEKVKRCFSVERIGGEYLEDFQALIDARSSGVRLTVRAVGD